MTRHQDPRLAPLDDLIARQEQVLAPAKAAGRKDKTKTVAANDDAIEHELDDVTLTVTPLQSAILDCLGAAEDGVPGPVLVKTVGKSKSSVDKAIEGLRSLLKNAGSKVELNGYRKRGFVLEMERDLIMGDGRSAGRPSKIWSEAGAVTRLCEMWGQGHSPYAISEVTGWSVSAIKNKAIRLGLPSVAKDGGRPRSCVALRPRPAGKSSADRRRDDLTRAVRQERLRQGAEGAWDAYERGPARFFQPGYRGQEARVDLAGLTAEHCRFPIDMPDGGVAYCGDTRHGNASYCLAHAARCGVSK